VFWLLTGSQNDAMTWLDFALALPGEADPDDRTIAKAVRALNAVGESSDPEFVRCHDAPGHREPARPR